jgi:hypothetical protein
MGINSNRSVGDGINDLLLTLHVGLQKQNQTSVVDRSLERLELDVVHEDARCTGIQQSGDL